MNQIIRVQIGGPEEAWQILEADPRVTCASAIDYENEFAIQPSSETRIDKLVVVNPQAKFFTIQEGLDLLKSKGLERPMHEHAFRAARMLFREPSPHVRPVVVFLHEPISPKKRFGRHSPVMTCVARWKNNGVSALGPCIFAHGINEVFDRKWSIVGVKRNS
jgi:hypothetical protein